MIEIGQHMLRELSHLLIGLITDQIRYQLILFESQEVFDRLSLANTGCPHIIDDILNQVCFLDPQTATYLSDEALLEFLYLFE